MRGILVFKVNVQLIFYSANHEHRGADATVHRRLNKSFINENKWMTVWIIDGSLNLIIRSKRKNIIAVFTLSNGCCFSQRFPNKKWTGGNWLNNTSVRGLFNNTDYSIRNRLQLDKYLWQSPVNCKLGLSGLQKQVYLDHFHRHWNMSHDCRRNGNIWTSCLCMLSYVWRRRFISQAISVAPQFLICNRTLSRILPPKKARSPSELNIIPINYTVLSWTHCRAVLLHCQAFLLFYPIPVLSCRALKLLNCIWNILFQSSVTLDDVFSFLMDFRADESLCRGTQIWNQVHCIKDTEKNTKPKKCFVMRVKVVCLANCFSKNLRHCCSHVPGYWTMKAVSSPELWMEIVLVPPQRKKLYEATYSEKYTPISESQLAQVSLTWDGHSCICGRCYLGYTCCNCLKFVSLLLRSHWEVTQPSRGW